MFEGLKQFNLPLNKWDVSNVTDMSYMFRDARSFNQPLNDWNVSNVRRMRRLGAQDPSTSRSTIGT